MGTRAAAVDSNRFTKSLYRKQLNFLISGDTNNKSKFCSSCEIKWIYSDINVKPQFTPAHLSVPESQIKKTKRIRNL